MRCIGRDRTQRAGVQSAVLLLSHYRVSAAGGGRKAVQGEKDRSGLAGRFELLVQSVTDYAIYMLDPSGIVTSWNAGAERLKGYVADEIVGQHFSKFYTTQDRVSGQPARVLNAAAETGRYEGEGWRV